MTKRQIIELTDKAINELLDLQVELKLINPKDRETEFKRIKAEKRQAYLIG